MESTTNLFDTNLSPPPYYMDNTFISSYQDTSMFINASNSSHIFPLDSSKTASTKTNTKRRSQVKNACVNCQKACKKCDEGRPCQRCIKLGITETCINSPRKERKKGFKRGPYKKKSSNTQQQTTSKKVIANELTSPPAKLKERTISNASSLSFSPSLVDWPLDYSPLSSGQGLAQSGIIPSQYHTQYTSKDTANLAEQNFYNYYNNNASTYQPKQPEPPFIMESYDPSVPVIDYSTLVLQQEPLFSINQQKDLCYYPNDYTNHSSYNKSFNTSQLIPKLEIHNNNGIAPPAYDDIINQTGFADDYLNSKHRHLNQHENNFLYNQWPKETNLFNQQTMYYDSQFF
ncbi:uncharacterized protein B0P05DRAFT_593379 [Gilbertella persicaria]|uniref:uncharacterized protein n=1 Tax=Gilbertella persicaria TaxID=101096 RepID=UPI00221EB227|nr:uncharacterized protein B0P05DRAFT_593379 [Gilbertella persicaria]KAI8097990.1 hypothetical protein B0P05DRAFT_593379 [Gilbertella persicaria]